MLPGGLPSRNDQAPSERCSDRIGGAGDLPTVQLDQSFSASSKSPLFSVSLSTQPPGRGVATGWGVVTGCGVELGWGGGAIGVTNGVASASQASRLTSSR